MNTDRFQGMCLKSTEGWNFMHQYDRFPPDIRLRLQSSDYNLCPMCLNEIARNPHFLHKAIDQMETMIRQLEGNIYG